MKMPPYLKNWTATYGHLVELVADPIATRAWTQGWDIAVIAKMPQKGITMKLKAGVYLWQQLAIQADRLLETIGKS